MRDENGKNDLSIREEASGENEGEDGITEKADKGIEKERRGDAEGKTELEKTPGVKFPIVGLGASAGGLEALKTFFANVSENSAMAYVVVSHMKADQPSMLPKLLQKVTPIPVMAAEDGIEIQPNHIYVLPPNKQIGVSEGKIRLEDIPKEGFHFPVDLFFRSLAKERKNRSAAVVLSGTGTDGTIGIKEIKDMEGLVVAQSEESAQYAGMPRSAIGTGIVDAVLPPEKMPETIAHFFSRGSGIFKKDRAAWEDKEVEKWLESVFHIVRNELGHDFSLYKNNTLFRRIERRMALNRVEDKQKYVRFLRENPNEIKALFQEMLIGVTNFFRDPPSFQVLKEEVLPRRLDSMDKDDTFRAWVPGCSTGEDVYSIAMVLKECLDRKSKPVGIQLFGTDVDSRAVEKAREGVFPTSIAADVSEERLSRFFYKDADMYRIRKEIRDCVVFSTHDVLSDPPFSRLDLLCCRNLLIYLNSQAQKKLLPLFHYTLKSGGILMLGSSESIGGFWDLFEIVNKKWKIYKRKEVAPSRKFVVDFPSRSYKEIDRTGFYGEEKSDKEDLEKATREAILRQFSPTAVLVDEKGNIKHVEGRTGKYLETVTGPPTHNILDMSREGLRVELSAALRKARTSKETVKRGKIRVRSNGEDRIIDLHVSPQTAPKSLVGTYLVIFEDSRQSSDDQMADSNEDQEESRRITELEKELQHTRESHQTAVEELESSNEELRSTNEELQSSNEELQSINEELESSKEELQSLNEELHTMNSELENNIEELSRAHDDMRNLLNSTEIATIFVDNDLRVRRFTPDTTHLVNLIRTDIGRPLKHVSTNFHDDQMMRDLAKVMENLKTKEKEVKTDRGEWYKMRIMPYRTTDDKVDGAVITFFSIDEQKKSLVLVRRVFDMNPGPLAVLDKTGRLVIANDSFVELLEIGKEDVQGRDVFSLVHGILGKTDLKKKLKKALEKGEDFETESFQMEHEERKFYIRGEVIREANELPYRILLSFRERD